MALERNPLLEKKKVKLGWGRCNRFPTFNNQQCASSKMNGMEIIMNEFTSRDPPQTEGEGYALRILASNFRYVVPSEKYDEYGVFAKWTRAGGVGGVPMRRLRILRHWENNTIYEIEMRLVGGACCGREGLFGRPPFNNDRQFKNWLDGHEQLPSLVLSRWVRLMHEMPPMKNWFGNVILMLTVHVAGGDVIEFLEIMNNIQNVTIHEMRVGEVRGDAVGDSVRLRRHERRRLNRDDV